MIDTLSIAENLTAAGFELKQAKAIASAVGQQHEETATKDFVRSEISPVRSDVVALKWMMGVNLAITLALFAVVLAG